MDSQWIHDDCMGSNCQGALLDIFVFTNGYFLSIGKWRVKEGNHFRRLKLGAVGFRSTPAGRERRQTGSIRSRSRLPNTFPLPQLFETWRFVYTKHTKQEHDEPGQSLQRTWNCFARSECKDIANIQTYVTHVWEYIMSQTMFPSPVLGPI